MRIPSGASLAVSVLVAAALSVPSAAHSDTPFQIKGLAIGQDAASACAGAVAGVQSPLDDLVRANQDRLPKLRLLRATQCEIRAESFAGEPLSEPLRLLFVDDRLIRVLIDMGGLGTTEFVGILKAMTSQYGPPVRRSSKTTGFHSATWSRNGQALELSWVNRGDWTVNLQVIMSNVKQYSELQRTYAANKRVFEQAVTADRALDSRR